MALEPFKEELAPWSPLQPLPDSPDDEDWYKIDITGPIEHDFHPGAMGIEVWGYNGQYPGPVIVAHRNRYVQVTWRNTLSKATLPFSPKDTAGVIAPAPMPSMHTAMKPGHAVVHLHGAHVPSDSDGWPETILHSTSAGHGEHSATFRYPNRQPGATLWYHDHTMGITRYNVYAGLAGVYLLREENEESLNLPSGKYEMPLVIQDRMFDFTTSPTKLGYEVNSVDQPEFFGDHIVVNGKVWPKMTVEPRRYRFRMINGSNSRFYSLSLNPSSAAISFPDVYQIGTDGGFLDTPIPIGSTSQPKLTLAPGERADVIIDFTACTTGDEFVVTNDARAPFPGDPTNSDGIPDPDTTGLVLKFIVGALTSKDTSCPVQDLRLPGDFTTDIGGQKVPLRDESAVAAALANAGLPPIRVRTRTLTEDAHKMVLLDSRSWDEPVTETPLLNGVEIWQIDNRTGDTHPIHLHLVQFLILDRTDLEDGSSQPIEPNEIGWKDTLRCPPAQRTRIIVRFTDYAGWYVWHCHMLEHEDHDMMRPIYVRQATEPDGVQPPRPEMEHH